MMKMIVIIGVGIVGVFIVIWMQWEGYKVILIDKVGFGEGVSYGNGGVLVFCFMIFVMVFGLLCKVLKMLFLLNQFLFLKWGYLLKLLFWLIWYLGYVNVVDVKCIVQVVYGFVGDSLSEYQMFVVGIGVEYFIVLLDYLFFYWDWVYFEDDVFGWLIWVVCGFEWEELEGDVVVVYDQGYFFDIGFVVKLKDYGCIIDLGVYVKVLVVYVEINGVEIVWVEVCKINYDVLGMILLEMDFGLIMVDDILIVIGVWFKFFVDQLGLNV